MSNELFIFIIVQFSFIVGFLLGRNTRRGENIISADTKSLFDRQGNTPAKMKVLKIDEAKFVTKVQDSALAKSTKELGKAMSVDDDIGSSVSRLAQLKKNK